MLDGAAGSAPAPEEAVTGSLPEGVTLEPGERALWSGQSARAPWWFGPQDLYLSVFALVWLAAMIAIADVSASSGSPGFLVFQIPFALAGGLYPAAGRVLHRRLRIQRTTYVLTDRRLIAAWQLGGKPTVVQSPLGRLLPPAARPQGVFTLPLEPVKRRRSNGWPGLLWPAATTTPPALIGIDHPAEVRDQILLAQLALRAQAPEPAGQR